MRQAVLRMQKFFRGCSVFCLRQALGVILASLTSSSSSASREEQERRGRHGVEALEWTLAVLCPH